AGALPPRARGLRAGRSQALPDLRHRRAARRGGRAGMRHPDRPPRPGRGILIRALLAAILTVSLSATAVAYAVLSEVDSLVDDFGGGKQGRTFVEVPEVSDAEAGDPRTFLILGTDERYADKVAGVKPRSDTILLARVD